MRIVILALVLGTAVSLGAPSAYGASAQEKCNATRLKAKGKYEKCVADFLAKTYAGSAAPVEKLAKCRVKYGAIWAKLQKLTGTACDQPRFEDNSDGTILDNLTGLVWEKKGDDGGDHDRDNIFTWSAGPPYYGDGTAFTTFLTAQLNTPGFASGKDWRLPSFAELQTILRPESSPCSSNPCVPPEFDTACTPGCAVATCSCTSADYHWSATDNIQSEDWAWIVHFGFGSVSSEINKANNNFAVRAVRGGF